MANPLDALKGFLTGTAATATGALKTELGMQAREYGPWAAAGFVVLTAVAVTVGILTAGYVSRSMKK